METKELKKRSLKGVERYQQSPFREELHQNQDIDVYSKKLTKDKALVDPETGEVHDIPVLTTSEYVWKDSGSYTKIFRYKDNVSKMSTLGSPAVKMLCYAIENLGIGTDVIMISFKDFCSYAGNTARTTYYDAVNELVNAKIIALSTSTGAYFINPNFMFNGKREMLLPPAAQAYANKQKAKFNEL